MISNPEPNLPYSGPGYLGIDAELMADPLMASWAHMAFQQTATFEPSANMAPVANYYNPSLTDDALRPQLSQAGYAPTRLPAASKPTYAQALGNNFAANSYAAMPEHIVESISPDVPPCNVKLSRKATDSFQQQPDVRPGRKEKKPRRPSTRMPTSHPTSMDTIIDAQVEANSNYQGFASISPGTISAWSHAPRIPGQRTPHRATPPLRVDTQHLSPSNHLRLPQTPSQLSTVTSSPMSASSYHSAEGFLAPPTPSHFSSAPSSPASATSARSPRRSQEEMRSSPAPFRCEDCNSGFDTQQAVQHHQRNHLPDESRKHVCKTCAKRFLHPKDLRRHEKVHEEPQYFCTIAGCTYNKGFKRDDHLRRHMEKKHGVIDSVFPSSF
jgi:hypothetical protein